MFTELIKLYNGEITLASFENIVQSNTSYINDRGPEGLSLLEIAIGLKKPKPVELLLKHGANPNLQDENGNTPLIIASFYGLTDIVQLLLSYKNININLKK